MPSPPLSSSWLYHGTGIYCLAHIALSNTLREGGHWGKPDEPHGPRLSEQPELAARFILYSSYWGEGGLVVFDRSVLARHYSLQSYRDRFYEGEAMPDEAEVAILSPEVNLDHGLISLTCDPRIIEEARKPKWMACAEEEGGWSFPHGPEGQALALKALDVLARHPKLNVWVPPTGHLRMGNFPLPPLPRTNIKRLPRP